MISFSHHIIRLLCVFSFLHSRWIPLLSFLFNLTLFMRSVSRYTVLQLVARAQQIRPRHQHSSTWRSNVPLSDPTLRALKLRISHVSQNMIICMKKNDVDTVVSNCRYTVRPLNVNFRVLIRSFYHTQLQHAAFRSSIYLYSLSTVLWECAARILVTSFLCSSRYFGFLSLRCLEGGHCRCCGMPSHPRA
jgi:hypothetical protein